MAESIKEELKRGEDTELQLTPMIDMAFLIIIFFMCLPFKTLEGKLQAFLPTDKGINATPEEPPPQIKISIHIMARKFRKRPWGPKGAQITVEMPSEVVYKRGDLTTKNLKEVGRWIREAKAAAQEGNIATEVVGEIKAGHRVPHKFVIAVLNKFAAAGIEKVEFYGTKIPPPALRKVKLLPYPKADYVGVEGS